MAKVMIVDDSTLIRELAKRTLKAGGYKDTIEATSAAEAIQMYKSKKPDLVLLDMVMEEHVSGLRALDELKKIDPKVKVIMLTSVKHPMVQEEAAKVGICSYLVKPFDQKTLIGAVKNALGK